MKIYFFLLYFLTISSVLNLLITYKFNDTSKIINTYNPISPKKALAIKDSGKYNNSLINHRKL